MRLFQLFFVLVLLISGCARTGTPTVKNGSSPEKEKIGLTVAYAWQPTNQALGPTRTTFYQNRIYYLQYYEESINIAVHEKDGTLVETIRIPRGKGPGEVMYPVGLRIRNDIIYLPDIPLRRVTLFEMDGTFIDTWPMSQEAAAVYTLDVKGDRMVFNSFTGIMLGVSDFRDNTLLYSIPLENKGFPGDGDPFVGGPVLFDPTSDDIFFGHADAPYRIVRYDSTLQPKMVITKESSFSLKPAVWKNLPGRTDMSGDMLVSSMALDEHYIYAPLCEMRMEQTPDHFEVHPIKGAVCVFDKETGTFLYELTVPFLNDFQGNFTVIGADHESILVAVTTSDETLSTLFPPDDSKDSSMMEMMGIEASQAIIVFDNPLYP